MKQTFTIVSGATGTGKTQQLKAMEKLTPYVFTVDDAAQYIPGLREALVEGKNVVLAIAGDFDLRGIQLGGNKYEVGYVVRKVGFEKE